MGLLLFRQNILFLFAISIGIGLMFSLSACGSDSTDSNSMMEEATVSATQQVATVAATAAAATSSPTASAMADAYYPKTVKDLLDLSLIHI